MQSRQQRRKVGGPEAPLLAQSKRRHSSTVRATLTDHTHKKAPKSKPGKTYECKNCPEEIFNSRVEFLTHIESQHKDDPTHFPLQCDQEDCQLRFATKTALRWHYKDCHGKRLKVFNNKCRICQKTFLKKENFELHRLSCGKNRGEKSGKYFLTCKLCPGSRFRHPVRLRRHQRIVHPGVIHDDKSPEESRELALDLDTVVEDEPLPCEVAGCKDRFSLPQELENHSKMHGQFSCSMCSVVMTFAPDLAHHEADEHGKTEGEDPSTSNSTIYQCPRCTFTINCCQKQQKSSFVKHFLSTHLNLDWATLICAICGARCGPREHMERRKWQNEHFRNVHDVSNMNPADVLKCDQCPANFRIMTAMNQHKKTVHAMKLKCEECDKEFTTRYHRRMHLMKVHKTPFSFSCSAPGCTHKFPFQDDLSAHIEKVHKHETLNGELKTYKCRQCGHLSKGKLEYLRHMVVHNNTTKRKEKPSFVCEQCGKAFKAKEHLHMHKLAHSGPDSWQFCCDICGRKFISKHKLAEHGRTHTKEKPFQCSVCGEKYAHRHNLRNHINKKHADVIQDIPRRFDKSNLTSKKRRRNMSEEDD